MKLKYPLLLIIAFATLGCAKKSAIVETKKYEDNIDLIKVYSPQLEMCEYEEDYVKTLFVYLPDDYETSGRNYPVIYYLNGYTGDATELFNFDKGLDQAREEGIIDDFILVAIDGNNRFQGGFYTDSPISGNFESYIMEDVIPLIDANYRTIPERESRGLFGFSMGGFGALKLALAHPDQFGAAFSLCGAIYDEDSTDEVLISWQRFMQAGIPAYTAAFTSDGGVPVFDGSDEDEKIIEEWKDGMSNWDKKVAYYLAQEDRLKDIAIAYGSREFFTWLNDGALALSDILTEENINHDLMELNIDHRITHATVQNNVMPFFAENLVFE